MTERQTSSCFLDTITWKTGFTRHIKRNVLHEKTVPSTFLHDRFFAMKTCVLTVLLCVSQHVQPSHAAEQQFTVSGYCEAFAQTYCAQQTLTYEAQSIRTTPHSEIWRFLSNVFQPADSTFTATYQCAFRAQTHSGQVREIAVTLLLTRTKEFAVHTQWERLQLIPIAYVTDATRNRTGYGVFKYLETPQ